MTQWYFHPSAQADRIGPLDDQAARRYAQANPRALAWCQGMSGWTSIAEVPELHFLADEAEFDVVGQEMQFVDIEIDPGESAGAEVDRVVFTKRTTHIATVVAA
ncbi:DUF4339 domain-containing protein, partial [Stenotrophomonas maltophilia]|uniref:DUF4339 domain-containing protein n=1 Tax=Stenotrophomonas maltophilia TaxID=40324 RepID=UPI001303FC70